MRSLTVRREKSSRPLFCKGRSVSGCLGGGKSRLRGIKSHLHGRLVSLSSERSQEVAHLLLTGVDDLSGRSAVDGLRDLFTEFLEVSAQLFAEGIGTELRLGVHENFRKGGAWEPALNRVSVRGIAESDYRLPKVW